MKKGLLHAILASTLWATVNSFIKQELGYDFTPMNFSETRFPTVEIILFAYTRHKGIWQESVSIPLSYPSRSTLVTARASESSSNAI